MKRVLVLGGYGGAGRAVTEKLVERVGGQGDVQIVAAGRDHQKLEGLAETVPGLATHQVDVANPKMLKAALSDVHIVINCIGPYISTGSTIAEAALDAGIAYLDLASEQEHFRRLESLNGRAEKLGVPLLTGLGAYPGLSGLMLRALLERHPRASSANMALVTGHPRKGTASGAAVIASGLLELRFPQMRMSGGRLTKFRPGQRRCIDFGSPFDEMELMEWPQSEVLAFAKEKRLQEFSCWIAVDGQRPTPAALLRAAGLLPLDRSTALRKAIVAAVKAMRRGPSTTSECAAVDWGAVRVAVSGEFGSISQTASVKGLGMATAWLPVYAVSEWLGGRLVAAGLKLPFEVFDSDKIVTAFRQEPNVRWCESIDDAPSSLAAL